MIETIQPPDIDGWALDRVRTALYRYRATYATEPTKCELPRLVVRLDPRTTEEGLTLYGVAVELTNGVDLVLSGATAVLRERLIAP